MNNRLPALCLLVAASACGGSAAPRGAPAVDAQAGDRQLADEQGGSDAANAGSEVGRAPAPGQTAAGRAQDGSASAPAAAPSNGSSSGEPAAGRTVIARAAGDAPDPPVCQSEGEIGMVQRDGDRIRLIEPIQYVTGKDKLRPESHRMLDQLARVLCADPSLRVEVGVHTDSRGSNLYNLKLSERRAQAVKAYLYQRGVVQQRVEARGYGETMPISHMPPRHQRRTEIKVLAQ